MSLVWSQETMGPRSSPLLWSWSYSTVDTEDLWIFLSNFHYIIWDSKIGMGLSSETVWQSCSYPEKWFRVLDGQRRVTSFGGSWDPQVSHTGRKPPSYTTLMIGQRDWQALWKGMWVAMMFILIVNLVGCRITMETHTKHLWQCFQICLTEAEDPPWTWVTSFHSLGPGLNTSEQVSYQA